MYTVLCNHYDKDSQRCRSLGHILLQILINDYLDRVTLCIDQNYQDAFNSVLVINMQ